MRILVTGATGFLGSHVVKRLVARHEVYAVVRGNVVPPDTVPIQANFELPLATADWPVTDAVMHLAQSPHYRSFPDGAASVFAVGALATQGLLEYAVRVGAKRFIFASTGGLYAPSNRPLREDDPLDIGETPLAHYLASKRAGELIASAYGRSLDVTVLRIFFCYGPGQSAGMLMPRLAQSVRDGRSIRLTGEHGLRINPIFIDDAAALVAKLAESTGPDIVNVAGPAAISLKAMGETLGGILGRPPTFEYDGGSKSPSLVADIGRLEAVVGRPLVGPEEGLARLVQSLS